jgi:hypothetical protein
MTILWLGLGVGFVTNLTKAWLPKPLSPAGKLSLALLLSLLAGAAAATDVLGYVTAVLGIAAISTGYHAVHKFVEAAGDERRVATLRRR